MVVEIKEIDDFIKTLFKREIRLAEIMVDLSEYCHDQYDELCRSIDRQVLIFLAMKMIWLNNFLSLTHLASS